MKKIKIQKNLVKIVQLLKCVSEVLSDTYGERSIRVCLILERFVLAQHYVVNLN